MRYLIAGLIAVSSIAFTSLGSDTPQDQQPVQRNASAFMIKKLDSSREIVGGLAMENYDSIRKAAQDLLLLSHESDWNVITTESYLHMSSDFRGSVGRLRDAGHEKNIDSATLAYFEVTLNCVRCHKYVRDQFRKQAGEGIRDRIRRDIEESKELKQEGEKKDN